MFCVMDGSSKKNYHRLPSTATDTIWWQKTLHFIPNKKIPKNKKTAIVCAMKTKPNLEYDTQIKDCTMMPSAPKFNELIATFLKRYNVYFNLLKLATLMLLMFIYYSVCCISHVPLQCPGTSLFRLFDITRT